MPGFLRACYQAFRRYLSERGQDKKPKTKKFEVEEMKLDKTNTRNERQVSKAEKLTLKNYLHLRRQLLYNLEQLNTIDNQTYVRKSDLQESYVQEIDLLTQLLDAW